MEPIYTASLQLLRSFLAQPPTQRVGCKWGVWGEGPAGAGSPQSCSAKLDLWLRGPWRAPVPHESAGSVRSPSRWMMAQPLGFRVSGAFGTKAPIKKREDFCESSRVNYEGCYYVTPRIVRLRVQCKVTRPGTQPWRDDGDFTSPFWKLNELVGTGLTYYKWTLCKGRTIAPSYLNPNIGEEKSVLNK